MTMASGIPRAIVPIPPSPLECNVLTFPAGTIVHRIHDSGLGAEQFNPGIKGDSRFAPIKTADGTQIPTSYAATTYGCAAFETVFHDIDPKELFKSVAWTRIEKLSYSTLEFSRDIRLARFFSADLMKWNCLRTQLIDTPPTTYPQTRRWSMAVHASDNTIDGMVWTSRKYDEEKAMLLFGTRVKPGDLVAKSSVVIVSDARALGDLHALAKMSGILISR
jgi:RES domain